MNAKKLFIAAGLAALAVASPVMAAGETPVVIPTELAPIGMLGTLLTDHKGTIIGLIGFTVVLALIGAGVRALMSRFGSRGKLIK